MKIIRFKTLFEKHVLLEIIIAFFSSVILTYSFFIQMPHSFYRSIYSGIQKILLMILVENPRNEYIKSANCQGGGVEYPGGRGSIQRGDPEPRTHRSGQPIPRSTLS